MPCSTSGSSSTIPIATLAPDLWYFAESLLGRLGSAGRYGRSCQLRLRRIEPGSCRVSSETGSVDLVLHDSLGSFADRFETACYRASRHQQLGSRPAGRGGPGTQRNCASIDYPMMVAYTRSQHRLLFFLWHATMPCIFDKLCSLQRLVCCPGRNLTAI